MSSSIPRIRADDEGEQDVAESSDDHFSSASEGPEDPKRLSLNTSPVPITRVERVDDTPAHGEVPGTPAYQMRMQDAVPDEIEVVPEGQQSRTRSRAASRLSENDRPGTPGGSPIPKTVVERVDDKPAHGEVIGTDAYEKRKEDAQPDEVRQVGSEVERNGRPNSSGFREAAVDHEVDDERRQAWFKNMWEGGDADTQEDDGLDAGDADQDDFGDDFDDFAEGGGDDDDFGEFDEGDGAGEHTAAQQVPPQPKISSLLDGLPPLDLASYATRDQVNAAINPYLDAIFPSKPPPPSEPPPRIDPSTTSPFLSDRSLSLWQQLVSPPPMQPVNWTRSRIRRLFLVSLGVPVDLDEILPPSKQKRLVLPNINLTSSPRPSTALDRLKQEGNSANASTTSLDSKGNEVRRKKTRPPGGRSGPAPPPDFDTNAASLLSRTTDEAMRGWTDAELKQHIRTLEELNQKASKVLEYWLQRKDEGIKEKEALEGVIENLVGFVKARGRGGGK